MNQIKPNNDFDIVTRIGSFKKTTKNIGEITYHGTTDATVKEISDFLEQVYVLMNNKPFYIVNNLVNDLGSFSADIWKFIGTDTKHNTFIQGSVIVTTSMGYEMQIKFFFKQFKPKYPAKIVSNKTEAYQWLNTLINSTSS